MKRAEIQRIRIDVLSDSQSALSLMMDKQGMIRRQGNGQLPIDETSVTGSADSSIFETLIGFIDEAVMPFANVYDHPNKIGTPLTVSVAFMSETDEVKAFEFRLGTGTTDVGDLFPFFDGFISQAITVTEDWYEQEKAQIAKSDHSLQ